MARPLRLEYPGAAYHITARGNERSEIFLDESDYQQLLEQLRLARERHSLVIHAYVLMRNHYHLLIETPYGNLSQVMHLINSSYTGYFNRRHRRAGHLFQGRYKSLLVEKESYLLELSRYIHLNPVRAGFVKHPEKYRWSSYRTFVGSTEEEWLCRALVWGLFSPAKEKAIKAYREFVEEALKNEIANPFAEPFARSILGSKGFVDEVQRIIENQSPGKEVPAMAGFKKQPGLAEIARLVAEYYGVEQESLGKVRQRENRSRKVAIYLARKHTGMTLKEIACYFGGMGHTGASQGINRLEKRRQQDLQLDSELCSLESILQSNLKCQV